MRYPTSINLLASMSNVNLLLLSFLKLNTCSVEFLECMSFSVKCIMHLLVKGVGLFDNTDFKLKFSSLNISEIDCG